MDNRKGFTLNNERLEVNIAYPGTVYSSSRFDWIGHILQIKLDGKHVFCMPESLIPGQGTGGIGLCNEFGIHTPVGYTDALAGEKFPKIGIGLLTKPDNEEYLFHRPYEIIPFNATITSEEYSIKFMVEPMEERGYAIQYNKEISIKDNGLKIHYNVKNMGKKIIKTNEYCHNFVAVDNNTIGNDYSLKFSFEPEFVEAPTNDVLFVGDNELKWKTHADSEFYCRLKGFSEKVGGYWELIHRPSGIGMREIVDFKVSAVAVWGTPHVVSPEVFINLELDPGESVEWTRTYEFFSTR